MRVPRRLRQAAIDDVPSFVTVTDPDVLPVTFVPVVSATVAELDEPAVRAPVKVQPANVTVAWPPFEPLVPHLSSASESSALEDGWVRVEPVTFTTHVVLVT